MSLIFEPVAVTATLQQQKEFLSRLSKCGQITSDYSFINIWGWAEEHDLSWAWEKDLVWIRQDNPSRCYWAPIGPWQQIDWPERFKKNIPEGARFVRVPESLTDILKNKLLKKIQITESRGHWDYLYDLKDLVLLKGNRFHKKKNLVNQFKKTYVHTLVPLGPEFAEQALALQDDWCLWRDCESIEALAAENRVIKKVFANWHAFENLMGAGIMVGSRLVAYTVAEPLDNQMILIHFEKGNTDYKGVYQAINQIFLESVQEKFSVVNREQDLDDEGLRKAKMSYQPSGFQKKYELIYNGG
jgi:hypothetical protein